MNEAEDEELEDEDYEEDLDEDCLNRRHVKYNSEQIVEKQQQQVEALHAAGCTWRRSIVRWSYP